MINKNNLTLLLEDLNKDKNNFFNNITKIQGEFLAKLVEIQKPKKILELGTSNGYSTLYLLKNINDDSIVTTIDIDEKRYNLAKENFIKIDATSNVEQKLGDGMAFLNECETKFDIIFVDFLQSKYYESLITIIKRELFNKQTTLIFDNYISHRTLELKNYCEENGLKYTIVKMGKGFFIINF